MRRILLILIFAAALSACAGNPLQAKLQQMIHPCKADYLTDLLWSPDGKQIGYLSDGNQSGLRITDIDTRITRSIDIPGQLGNLGQWWPDRESIIYFGPGGFEVINFDGSFGSQPEVFGEVAFDVRISPNGDHLAYVIFSNYVDRESDLFIGDANGANSTKIYSGEVISLLRWSPDGKYIAFAEQHNLGQPIKLKAISVDSGDIVQLADDFNGLPVWSPDSGKIAFFKGRLVNIINADGTGFAALTYSQNVLVWLPDSSGLIGAIPSTDPYMDVFRVDLDGTETRLSSGIFADLEFSPDGSKVAYISYERGPHPDLYVMNVDGTNKILLTHNPGYNTCFDWPF